MISYFVIFLVYSLLGVFIAVFCDDSILFFRGNFAFQGYTSQILVSNGNLKMSSLKCSKLCLMNNSCFSYDICYENETYTCQLNGKSPSITELKETGNCQRLILVQACENEFQNPCRCRHKNILGERCHLVYDCERNIETLPMASYKFFRIVSTTIQLKCDMITDYGGWIFIQRRIDGSTDFYRGWSDYEDGFGDIDSNFYLGNRYINILTKEHEYELRVDMLLPDGQWRYAQYETFSLEDSSQDYKLTVYGYTGDAGDSFSTHSGRRFSTYDHDNSCNCPNMYRGGWWYSCCHSSNLNGEYGNNNYGKGLNWFYATTYYKSCVTTEIKIRRKR